MEERIWVSNDIFNSYGCVGLSKIIENERWGRSYEIWEHASNLITENRDEFSLADGLSNLKRSLNSRLQLIEEIYNFKEIEFVGKPKGYFELLETYGLVRPFIMKELLKIRNGIEHCDQKPPEIDRCKEFVDIIWYFLKSTDSVVQTVKHHIDFNILDDDGAETIYRYVIEIDWNNHYNLNIKGFFPTEYVSCENKENFIEIRKENCRMLSKPNKYRGVSIEGKCVLSKQDYHQLLKEIFVYAK